MKKLLFFLPLLFLCLACHKEPESLPEPEPQPKPQRVPEEIDIIDYIWKIEYWATPQDTFYPFRGLIRPLPEEYSPYRLAFFPNMGLTPSTVKDIFMIPNSMVNADGTYDYTKGHMGDLRFIDYKEGDAAYGGYTPFNDTLLKYIPTIARYEVYKDSLFLFGDSCQFLLLKERKNDIQYPQIGKRTLI